MKNLRTTLRWRMESERRERERIAMGPVRTCALMVVVPVSREGWRKRLLHRMECPRERMA